MKFLADENIDRPIVQVLRERGHEVLYVAEMERGVDDDFLSDLTREENAILVTADNDVGEIVFRQDRVLVVEEHASELPQNLRLFGQRQFA